MELSKINGLPYSLRDVARIIDQKQQKLYIKHNAYPVDMYTTVDEITGEDKLVMLFNRSETKDLYELWKKHELR